MRVCDWSGFAAECADVLAAVERAVPVAPFVLLAVPASARTQLQCAERFVKTRHPPAERPLWRGERYHNDRVRLAYLSADLRDHPVGYLTAGLFERHDEARFEVTALSVAGVPASSHVSRRISDAVERFVDVSSTSDEALADLIRQLKIDIVVDLGGFTTDGRLGVLAWRPAPVQVNYLGYIGTTGAAFIDYVIADKIALPFDQQPYFAEKIVHLPDCFVVTDDRVEAAALTPSRQQAGLPADGFVFCCFNNSYKLNGPLFERWTRLLRAVEGSVLWLAEASAEMAGNLRREAARCRIDPERLIFAPRLPHSEHLARQRLADLFLDTVPYNAGATAVAALWSGVPLVTLSGETFVSRMAASMLHAVGMPDLMTSNLDEYETLALKLAQNPNLLADARYRLQQNLPRKPLFDTDRFRRHLEAAFITMWQRAERGEPPQSFAVGAIGTERVH